jgi:hypothetical protein
MKPRTVVSSDPLQRGYAYELTEPLGKNFASDFRPQLTPAEMVKLGMFGGAYFTPDSIGEYPAAWFKGAKFSAEEDKALNYFGVKASQPMSVWKQKGWIYKDDPRGWVQWYFRYYLGRRIPAEDARQIRRWRQMVRHVAQVRYACRPGDFTCHTKQRQALLHWAYDSRKL